MPLNVTDLDVVLPALHLSEQVLLLEQDDNIAHDATQLTQVKEVRMQTPSHQLVLMRTGNLHKFLDDSDALQARVNHADEEFVSVELMLLFFVVAEAEAEVEDVLSHQIDDDALVVADFVLQVYDSQVLEV